MAKHLYVRVPLLASRLEILEALRLPGIQNEFPSAAAGFQPQADFRGKLNIAERVLDTRGKYNTRGGAKALEKLDALFQRRVSLKHAIAYISMILWIALGKPLKRDTANISVAAPAIVVLSSK
jgi:hypothetical protein